jgi:hypothetical protein
MLPNLQTRDCLIEYGVTEIGVLIVRAIPAPKTSVDSELGEIGEPAFLG